MRRRWPHKLTLFLVLGSIYVLAVLMLESAIMPLYVYRPFRRMLEADAATQGHGDRERESIPSGDIPGDEIGRIMRSHGETVGGSPQAARTNWPRPCAVWRSKTAW